MKQLSAQAISIQRHSRNQSLEQEIRLVSSRRKETWRSTSTFMTRPICMDHANRWSIIARATSWIRLCGTARAGRPRGTSTLIKIERNTENNSISRSRSTTELWSRVRASSATRTWPTSQEIWESLASAERSLTSRDSKKPEEDMKTASLSTLTIWRNERERRSEEVNRSSSVDHLQWPYERMLFP